MFQRGHSDDGCDLASTLCEYDLRKGDELVMWCERVRRVRRESISSELLMCGGGARSILLMPLMARSLETIDVCLFYACCSSDSVGVGGNVYCVAAVVKVVFFCLGVLKYVVFLCKECDGCCVFGLYCDAWSCRWSCMGSMRVAIPNAAFCMTCSLLMLVEDARGDHLEEAYSRAGLMTSLWVEMNVYFCLPHTVSVCACTEML